MKIIEKEFNAITGEETIFERNMTAEELAEYQLAIAKAAELAEAKAEAEAKREIALSKLAALGLDTDDLKALGL